MVVNGRLSSKVIDPRGVDLDKEDEVCPAKAIIVSYL
jgi:hypothetical protein